MATTSFGVNNALAVKLWSKKLAVEALKDCYLGKFTGSGSDSLIQVKTETQKSAGDKITFGLRMQLSGAGIQGDATLEGSEEALTTYNDAVVLDQLRHAVRSGGKMSEQRVPFSVREEAYAGLKDWWMDRFDQSFFYQAAGRSGVSDTRYTGNNAAVVPTATTNHIFCSADHTTDETLDSSGDDFSLVHLDKAVALAKTNSPMIRPIRTNGGEYYVAFLHPGQTLQLRTTTTTGYWQDIQKAALMGGNQKDNPLFTGALGVYNGVILHESTRVPKGQNSTTLAEVANTRRAILCGAQAATMAFGQGGGENKFSWTEELFDYENQLGVAAGSIFGLKKTIFNSKDFGTIVMSTYSLY
jgi:N4-gp56 family major capsid protein